MSVSFSAGAPTGPNNTAQLAVGIAGGIILAVVGGLVALTAFVCMKKRKSGRLPVNSLPTIMAIYRIWLF